jgi:hypothetical protein
VWPTGKQPNKVSSDGLGDAEFDRDSLELDGDGLELAGAGFDADDVSKSETKQYSYFHKLHKNYQSKLHELLPASTIEIIANVAAQTRNIANFIFNF